MRKSFTFSALSLGLLGTTSAMAATAGAPPLDVLLQPSTWVVGVSAVALIGLALGQGPSGSIAPRKARRDLRVAMRQAAVSPDAGGALAA